MSTYSPVNGASVPALRSTAYSSGDSSACHCSSVLVTFLTVVSPSFLPLRMLIQISCAECRDKYILADFQASLVSQLTSTFVTAQSTSNRIRERKNSSARSRCVSDSRSCEYPSSAP